MVYFSMRTNYWVFIGVPPKHDENGRYYEYFFLNFKATIFIGTIWGKNYPRRTKYNSGRKFGFFRNSGSGEPDMDL